VNTPTALAASEERKNDSKTAACQIDRHRFVAELKVTVLRGFENIFDCF